MFHLETVTASQPKPSQHRSPRLCFRPLIRTAAGDRTVHPEVDRMHTSVGILKVSSRRNRKPDLRSASDELANWSGPLRQDPHWPISFIPDHLFGVDSERVVGSRKHVPIVNRSRSRVGTVLIR